MRASAGAGPGPGGASGRRGGRRRLDEACIEQLPGRSRNLVQSWILQGKVRVDGKPVLKAGTLVRPEADVKITAEEPRYVCRGGLKLEAALRAFAVDMSGRVVLDSGLSSGGFTDCLLQHGASRVYGVDVGYGQVHETVRTDPRVTIMERTNLRHVVASDLPERVQAVTLDLSFISVLKVMDAVCEVLETGGDLIVLIKPQFEALKGQVGRGGVVRDASVHADVVERVSTGIAARGFRRAALIESPIRGASKGNKEFLGHFVRLCPGEADSRPPPSGKSGRTRPHPLPEPQNEA